MIVQRYQLKVAEDEEPIFMLKLPARAEVLSVMVQPGSRRVFLFALIDPNAPDEVKIFRRFRSYETAEQIPDGATFVCTFSAGPIFWHMFELRR